LSAAAVQVESPHSIFGAQGTGNWELGDWYLNASLFLPFQELNALYLSDNRIAGWVKNKDLLSYYKNIFRS